MTWCLPEFGVSSMAWNSAFWETMAAACIRSDWLAHRRQFDTARNILATAAFDHRLPVVVEAESSRIGNRQIPPSLWKRMASAGRIEILAPLRERARYIVGSYGELTGDRSALKARIKALQPFHPRETVVGWLQLAENGASEQLALELMEAHYDPRYRKHRARGRFDVLAALNLNSLDGDGLDSAAREISDLLLSQ